MNTIGRAKLDTRLLEKRMIENVVGPGARELHELQIRHCVLIRDRGAREEDRHLGQLLRRYLLGDILLAPRDLIGRDGDVGVRVLDPLDGVLGGVPGEAGEEGLLGGWDSHGNGEQRWGASCI